MALLPQTKTVLQSFSSHLKWFWNSDVEMLCQRKSISSLAFISVKKMLVNSLADVGTMSYRYSEVCLPQLKSCKVNEIS